MAIERLLDLSSAPPEPQDLYERIVFPDPPAERPYVYINMASTADGKIVVGDPGGSASGVGGPTDHLLFRRLQQNADGALLGATTLRASQVIYPPNVARFTLTRSGELPLQNRFFRDAPERAFAIVPMGLEQRKRNRLEAHIHLIVAGQVDVDLRAALRIIRHDHNIRVLLCEGGSAVNAQLIQEGLADELFLTIAPKLKGGDNLPTIVGGIGFPPQFALPLRLLSAYHDGDEIYLRYLLGEPARAYGRPRPPS